jgi:hypothetical protein
VRHVRLEMKRFSGDNPGLPVTLARTSESGSVTVRRSSGDDVAVRANETAGSLSHPRHPVGCDP